MQDNTGAARPRIFGAPLRYIQGPGALAQVGALARLSGRRALLVSDPFVLDLVGARVVASCAAAGVACTLLPFAGETTPAELRRLVASVGEQQPALVIAAGGGKGIDIGKALAKALGTAVITLPTAASNDAPTSKIFVLYDEDHRLLSVEHMDHNPAAVVVDTALIAQAPARLLLAGIGDALSKKFEVANCAAAGGANVFGGTATHTALALAELSYTLLRTHALPAMQAVQRGEPDAHVESLVEATVLLSGLCFENGGLSIAHALTRGLSALPGAAQALHGLQVAYGLLVQLTLEDGRAELLQDLRQFYAQLGLPRNLRELGVTVPPTDALLQAAAKATAAAPHTRNFPRPLSADDIARAMRQVEQVAVSSFSQP